jgi:hypothetical protein
VIQTTTKTARILIPWNFGANIDFCERYTAAAAAAAHGERVEKVFLARLVHRTQPNQVD